MRDTFLVFGQPLISQNEIDEVTDSLKNCWLGTGPKVNRFEHAFARYKNIDHCSAVNSCTAALHLACLSLNLEPGDEVITTAMTFCATINAIIHVGAKPVLADIDAETLNIDPKQIEQKITKKTKMILVVHFAGRPCEMNAIMDLARAHKLNVIEDCAHAIESEYHGQKTGIIGDIGCFSFYATKNITTGEGGMVISKDKETVDKIKIMTLHGMSKDAWSRFLDDGYKHYYVVEYGFKYNMMDLQAAIGLHQLKRIEEFWKKRKVIWEKYTKDLKDLKIGLPAEIPSHIRHAYHLFTIRINKETTGIERDQFLNEMTKRKIGVGVQYLSIPEHPYYKKKFHLNPSDYPHALRYGRETVSLPLSPKLTQGDVADVINAVRDIISQSRKVYSFSKIK